MNIHKSFLLALLLAPIFPILSMEMTPQTIQPTAYELEKDANYFSKLPAEVLKNQILMPLINNAFTEQELKEIARLANVNKAFNTALKDPEVKKAFYSQVKSKVVIPLIYEKNDSKTFSWDEIAQELNFDAEIKKLLSNDPEIKKALRLSVFYAENFGRHILRIPDIHGVNRIQGITMFVEPKTPKELELLYEWYDNYLTALPHKINEYNKDGLTPIQDVIQHGHPKIRLRMMKILLQHNADLNLKTKHGQTTLYFLIRTAVMGYLGGYSVTPEEIKLLLDNGAQTQINEKYNEKVVNDIYIATTPLHLISNAKYNRDPKIIALLKKYGATK
jgi:hypothetical protein